MRLILAALVLLISAQSQGPPRDPASGTVAKPAGTGVIRGRVVAADTGVPIRRALVTISGGGPGRGAPQTIYTDARGRYEVRDLLPGSYLLSARPNQYQGQYLPSVTPPSPSTDGPPRVTLADGQTLEGYDLALPRAGAITGRIVDENGDPVSGVYVQSFRVGDRPGYGNGAGSQSSDELGRYRLFRLPPGEYQILAKPSSGDFLQQGQSLGFIETYYPGTYSREEAGRVRVRGGQETITMDLQLTRARMLRVKGTVLDSRGGPASNRTMVSLAHRDGSSGTGIDAQGRFSFQPQQPGTYRLIARMADESRETTIEYASTPLTLVDADVEDVVISMKATVTLTGRVVFDAAAPPVLAVDALGIGAQPKDRSTNTQLPLSTAAVAADLTFTLRRIAGELLLRPSGRILAGWVLKAVLLGNQDITDVPTEFRAEDAGRLQVVLTNRASELAGSVTGEKGEPVTNCNVVLFSEDKAAWFGSSIRFRTTRPGRDGRFSIKGLRPGRYYLIALPPSRAIDDQAVNAATLEALVREATALVLGEDEPRVVDLKVVGPGGGH